VKRWEASLRGPPAPDPTSPEEIERDQAIRRNLANAFGFALPPEEPQHELTPAQAAAAAAEARLERDLRAAGLL